MIYTKSEPNQETEIINNIEREGLYAIVCGKNGKPNDIIYTDLIRPGEEYHLFFVTSFSIWKDMRRVFDMEFCKNESSSAKKNEIEKWVEYYKNYN